MDVRTTVAPTRGDTAESAWLTHVGWEHARGCDPDDLITGCSRIVVLAAAEHDPLVAVGGLLADLAVRGFPVERWQPGSAAIDAQTLVLAPWAHDPDPPSARLGALAIDLAAEAGAAILFYLVRTWGSVRPADLPWDAIRVITPSAHGIGQKWRLLDELPGPTLSAGRRAAARRVIEVLIDSPSAGWWLRGGVAERLDAPAGLRELRRELLDNAALMSPWSTPEQVATRDARVRAVLPTGHVGSGVLIGIPSPDLVRAFALACTRCTFFDPSGREKLERTSLLGDTRITWAQGALPHDLPESPVDLLVVTDAGTVLHGGELVLFLGRLRRLLRPGGRLVLAHARAQLAGMPLSGDVVHAQARSALDLAPLAHWRDDELVVDVWEFRSSRGGGTPSTGSPTTPR